MRSSNEVVLTELCKKHYHVLHITNHIHRYLSSCCLSSVFTKNSARKAKQSMALGLLLLAGIFTTPLSAQTVVNICDRTALVEAAILAAIPGSPACDAVTSDELAAITGTLDLSSMSISALLPGDFAGLSGLTGLDLEDNDLSALPTGVFDDLASLTDLDLEDNDLSALPTGIFSSVTGLTDLDLGDNDLTALPVGLFSGLTSLAELALVGNTFTTPLPGDLFADLPSTAVIQIDLSPIGDLLGVALTLSGTTTINVTSAFISRADDTGIARTLSFTIASADTAIATATESNGVVTITAAGMGTTTVSVTADDGRGGTIGMHTRDIAVTVVGTGILVFDEATGYTTATPVVAENSGTDMVYVQLASAPTSDVTLSVMSSNTNEGTVSPATLTFTDTNYNTRQALTVTAVPDNIDNDDTFMVDFMVMSGDGGNYTSSLMLPSVTVTVTDDDEESDGIELTVSPDSVTEGAGETLLTVMATLSGGAFASGETVVEVIIDDGGGTASPNTDYMLSISTGTITIPTGTITLPTSPLTTITIPAEATSGSGTFAITPIADDENDNRETIIISGTAISGISGSLEVNPATLRIIEFSREDQQTIEQVVAAQASGITQVVTEQIGSRLASRTSGSTQGGQSLSAIDWQDRLAKFTYEGLQRLDSDADMSLDWLLRATGGNGQLLMPLGAESLTLWVTGGHLSTKGDGVGTYDGNINSFILGVDTDFANDWVAGMAISYSDSEVGYMMNGSGGIEQDLYSFHPYLSRIISEGLTLWATGGYGFGDVDFSHTDHGQATSDVTQWMAAGGLEKQIITGTPWQAALRIKGLWGNAEVDAARFSRGATIAKVDTDFWRARMESEVGYNFSLLSGANIRPYAIIGGRLDHNDAIVSGDEWNIDVGGGVEMLSGNAFALNISVHTQVTDGDTEEDSIVGTGSLTYDLGHDRQGLQMTLSRPLNHSSWDQHSFSPVTNTASGLSSAPLTSELAYGWTVRPWGLKGALQTYVQNSFDSSDRHYAVGLELAVNALTLNFETGYHDHTSLDSSEIDNTGLESMFKTKIRW